MRSIKEKALNRMAELGVVLAKDNCIEAPDGYKMVSCGLHYAVFTGWSGVLADLEGGLEPCEPTCCPAFHG